MQNKRAVIVGIFMVIGIAILIVAIFTLGNQLKTFGTKITLKAKFEDINGLHIGNNVWFSGVKIGTVKKVDLQGNALVDITMSVDEKTQAYIHKDSKVKIGTDGFIGNKIVIIYGGTATSPSIEQNDYLGTEKMFSTDDMLATLQENNKNILGITQSSKSISQKIDTGAGTIGSLVNDKSLLNNIQATLANLQPILINLKATSSSSKEVMSNLVSFSDSLNKEGTSIHKLINDTSLYTDLNATIIQFKEAAKTVTDFADTMKVVGSKLNNSDNTMGLLFNDKETANEFKATMKNIESSSKKLDEDLEALQHNFLFRGFFKKKNKTSGDN